MAETESQDTNLDITSLPREVNIAELLDDEQLLRIGSEVVEGYVTDEDSRKDWLDLYQKAIYIANQVVEVKNTPWDNASNVKYPLLTIGALSFHARAYPSLLPSKGLVSTEIVGIDPLQVKYKQAKRVEMHMNYQFSHEMENWEEDMDRLLLVLPITGCEFKKTYFNSDIGINISEHVRATDLVVDYYAKDLESASRKTHLIQASANDIKSLQLQGIFKTCELGEANARKDSVTDTKDKATGINRPSRNTNTPYLLLEQHTFLDLDNDGYAEPYIITVEKNSKKVLRIVARFTRNGIVKKEGKVVKITPVEYFTKYDFIPNPSGAFYGIGFNILIGPLNHAVNTLINQLIDAGTLSNLQSGFISRNLRIRGGAYNFIPGEWKQVNATGQDLAQGIMPLPVREPSAVLFQLLSLLINAGERLTSTTDMMVGENPGQNQKATTTMAVLDQGMKVFTAIYKRIRKAMSKEFVKLFKLNSIYIDDSVAFALFDDGSGTNKEYAVFKEDYNSSNFSVIPSADPNVAVKAEKLQKAMALRAAASERPMFYDLIAVERRFLEAFEIESIDEVLLSPEEIQAPPPDPKLLEVQRKAAMDEHTKQVDAAELQLKAAELEVDAKTEEQKIAIEAKNTEIQELAVHGKIMTDAATTTIKAKEAVNKMKKEKSKESE